jgi:NTF2 fold immunity protein
MNFRFVLAGALITTIYFSLDGSAQTPAPISTPDQPQSADDYRVPLPKGGLVPDKETAIKIAEVVLFRLYGEEDIISQRPYKVEQRNDIWWINGTLKKNQLGSVFGIAISRQTGAILHLEH